jgi:hypothetical protein
MSPGWKAPYILEKGGHTVLAGISWCAVSEEAPSASFDRRNRAPGRVYTQEKIYAYQVREQVVVKETEGEVTMDNGAQSRC